MNYLGINITKHVQGPFAEKHKTVMKEIKEHLKELEKRNDGPWSCIVKVHHNKYGNSSLKWFIDLIQHQSKPQQDFSLYTQADSKIYIKRQRNWKGRNEE